MHYLRTAVSIGSVALMVLFASGCKNKKSTLEDALPPLVTGADTSFVEPAGFSDIDTTDDAVFREAELAQELERKVREALKPVYFDFNSFQLSASVVEQLATASSFLSEYKQLRVLVEGHCDERGSSEYNMGLGEKRAQSIKQYLVNYGIQPIRIEITSWGKEQPAEPYCSDDACHGRNRRAQFKVLAR